MLLRQQHSRCTCEGKPERTDLFIEIKKNYHILHYNWLLTNACKCHQWQYCFFYHTAWLAKEQIYCWLLNIIGFYQVTVIQLLGSFSILNFDYSYIVMKCVWRCGVAEIWKCLIVRVKTLHLGSVHLLIDLYNILITTLAHCSIGNNQHCSFSIFQMKWLNSRCTEEK